MEDEQSKVKLELNLNTNSLMNDISGRLGKLYPSLPLKEREDIAKQAVDELLVDGDHALYQGLVLYGVRSAKDKCQKTYT